MKMTSRMPRAEYDAIAGMNISRLKEMKRSPLHYRYALTHPKKSDALTLGNATHVATLEPERFDAQFAVWQARTESGAMAPRRGKAWDAFVETNAGRDILTPDEYADAHAIAKAVHTNDFASKYLCTGDPEVTLEWVTIGGRAAKGRVDWLTHIDSEPWIVGLKTARTCAHYPFSKQCAMLGYHMQWAYYFDGYAAITNTHPRLVEIVVESAPPYAVAVYRIPDDVIDQGRDDYTELLARLEVCEKTDSWPGPVPCEEFITLPSWAYPQTDDDISELGLE
jgi:hypothetical protein